MAPPQSSGDALWVVAECRRAHNRDRKVGLQDIVSPSVGAEPKLFRRLKVVESVVLARRELCLAKGRHGRSAEVLGDFSEPSDAGSWQRRHLDTPLQCLRHHVWSWRSDDPLVLFGGVPEVQLEEALQQLIVADVRLPAVSREDRNVEVAAEVVAPWRAGLVVELGEGELRVSVQAGLTDLVEVLRTTMEEQTGANGGTGGRKGEHA